MSYEDIWSKSLYFAPYTFGVHNNTLVPRKWSTINILYINKFPMLGWSMQYDGKGFIV
jgi:hypothetical protein